MPADNAQFHPHALPAGTVLPVNGVLDSWQHAQGGRPFSWSSSPGCGRTWNSTQPGCLSLWKQQRPAAPKSSKRPSWGGSEPACRRAAS